MTAITRESLALALVRAVLILALAALLVLSPILFHSAFNDGDWLRA